MPPRCGDKVLGGGLAGIQEALPMLLICFLGEVIHPVFLSSLFLSRFSCRAPWATRDRFGDRVANKTGMRLGVQHVTALAWSSCHSPTSIFSDAGFVRVMILQTRQIPFTYWSRSRSLATGFASRRHCPSRVGSTTAPVYTNESSARSAFVSVNVGGGGDDG
jgi:hypothetical protein